MALNSKITVEVAYATPAVQRIIALEVECGCTIEQAIDQSKILEIFPEIDLSTQKVGIFSQQKLLTDTLQQNDRVEIYRSLIIDPKDARRKRVIPAAKRKYKKRGFRVKSKFYTGK